MSKQNQPTSVTKPEALQEMSDIRRIMERSSRFISLSGLSGVAAGVFALVAAYFADKFISDYYSRYQDRPGFLGDDFHFLKIKLGILAAAVLTAALSLAFYFTWRRARQNRLPLWDLTSRKLMWNVMIPLIAGGIFILGMLQYDEWRFISPACLVFYGLALVNGSKYTLSDIRYLGFLEIILGLVNMQYTGYGIYFWALGFGVLHIIYGAIMWWKYERNV